MAVSTGFVSAEVSVRTEDNRDSRQELPGVEAWGDRDARQILPGLETGISRQEGETLRVLRTQLPTLFTNSKKQQHGSSLLLFFLLEESWRPGSASKNL